MQYLIKKRVHANCSDQGEYQNGVLMLTLDEHYFLISDKESKKQRMALGRMTYIQ